MYRIKEIVLSQDESYALPRIMNGFPLTRVGFVSKCLYPQLGSTLLRFHPDFV